MPTRNQYKHHYLQNLHEAELQALAERCREWGMHPTEFAKRVSDWFKNFREEADCHLALKLLKALEYHNEDSFNELLKDRQKEVVRYLLDNDLDDQRIWFALPSDLADSAVRHAHPLSKVWKLPNERFVSFDQIHAMLGSKLGQGDTLILFNDTHGSGKQFMSEVWPQVQPLVGKVGAVMIVGAAIAVEALEVFKKQALGAHIIPNHAMPTVKNMQGFTNADVVRLTELGRRVCGKFPLGFGDCGLLLAYHFQCPNNSLPLIWADGENNALDGKPGYPWNALFPYKGKIKIKGDYPLLLGKEFEEQVETVVKQIKSVWLKLSREIRPAVPGSPLPELSGKPRRGIAFGVEEIGSWTEDGMREVPLVQVKSSKPSWASTMGTDEIVPWAEICVKNVVQKLRWIKPGEFLMGSPEDEGEHTSDEGPQHRVTISQGFWLADTACTQALWQVVMGNNPSRFKLGNNGGSEHPVECVKWHDIQIFLQKLNSILPNCHVTLPTEAEWEYACRAGSTTPFSFGRNVNMQQVNYDGRFFHQFAVIGECRDRTVPVKELPANAWGLYQMHGNVWEWCADPWRKYGAQAMLDPGLPNFLAPLAEGQQVQGVMRGGSWRDRARFARSAYRECVQPVLCHESSGFRFVVRARSQASAPAR